MKDKIEYTCPWMNDKPCPFIDENNRPTISCEECDYYCGATGCLRNTTALAIGCLILLIILL